MNIGLVIPAQTKKKRKIIFLRLFRCIKSVFNSFDLKIHKVEIYQGIRLVYCIVPINSMDEFNSDSIRKKLRDRINKLFVDEECWPLLEHPKIRGILRLPEYQLDHVIQEVVIKRFIEVIKILRGVGDLSSREVVVTGRPGYLEYAITNLITMVNTLNLLIPKNSVPPNEAELAFIETGIPVHITSDPEVLKRSALWIRFPDDDESFDELPEKYSGIIVDLGAMKIIDTKSHKIFNIVVVFSDRIKRKIGSSILKGWNDESLESAIIAVCSNAWDISITESSMRLGMLLSFRA